MTELRRTPHFRLGFTTFLSAMLCLITLFLRRTPAPSRKKAGGLTGKRAPSNCAHMRKRAACSRTQDFRCPPYPCFGVPADSSKGVERALPRIYKFPLKTGGPSIVCARMRFRFRSGSKKNRIHTPSLCVCQNPGSSRRARAGSRVVGSSAKGGTGGCITHPRISTCAWPRFAGQSRDMNTSLCPTRGPGRA